MADQVLAIGNIRIHEGTATQLEAMKEAADILQATGAVTAEYFDAMQQREQTVSTYMGNELAIPHGTNEMKQAILDSALSFVRYDGGVDWSGGPVTFVVGIAGKGDEHLEILSRIAILFSDEDEVESLKRASTPEELFELLGGVTRDDAVVKAVHFGAGNIGRGFVGLLLHRGGYDVVFSDVAGGLVDAINAVDSYTVHEVGPGGIDTVVTGFRALNSGADPDAVAAEVATADVVTTAVGPSVLKFVAPLVLDGLRRRDPAMPPLQIMACENAIGATDLLRVEIVGLAGEEWDASRAVFANTAVDRIVPAQPAGAGVDVTVEPFFEWAIERPPFGDRPPDIPGAHFVDDLAPYIERKLYTVNTGHAATAYFGALAGFDEISDALADATIEAG